MSAEFYPLRVLWRIYVVLVFSFTFIILYPVFFFFLIEEERYKYAFRLKRFVAVFTAALSGIRLQVDARFELEPDRPVVICPNHQSMLDIIAIYCIFPHYFVFMGKQELKKVPLFRIFFEDMDIAVDRGSRMGAHRAWLRAAEDIDKGRPVVMFPEGTISRTAPELRPFKNGPFKLAIEKQVPVVPITFISNYKIFPERGQTGYEGGPGVARMVVHEPIDTSGMTEANLADLRKRTYNTINDTLHGYENRPLYSRQPS